MNTTAKWYLQELERTAAHTTQMSQEVVHLFREPARQDDHTSAIQMARRNRPFIEDYIRHCNDYQASALSLVQSFLQESTPTADEAKQALGLLANVVAAATDAREPFTCL